MKPIRNLKLALSALLVAGLAACGGGGGGSAAGSGSLRLALTDAPSCGYDAVNVTIQKVRVHQSSSAGDSDAGWSEVVLNPARRVNLLTLTNGVLDELGQTALPAGKYTQLRLVLADSNGASPLANSVVLTSDKTELALKTPSGQQSGVKTSINIDIAANQLADFVLDFNACKSVVVAGGSGQYLLKPVLSVVPRYVSGVTGFVAAAMANGNTGVSLQQGGVVIKATTPDSSGKFLLQPAAPGSYTLVLTAPDRSTAVVTNVVVVADTVTAVNASGAALDPTPSTATGVVAGTAPVDSLVHVLQPLTPALTGGTATSVEVAGRFVDSSTGGYSYPLVVNAPLVASYVAAPGALVFAADTAAAGKFTLNASLTGFTDKATVLGTLASGATITTHFTFP